MRNINTDIGKHIDIGKGTYARCYGKILSETTKMFYVEVAGHSDTKQVMQTSVVFVQGYNPPCDGIKELTLEVRQLRVQLDELQNFVHDTLGDTAAMIEAML
jgi:hypothetical protein